MGKEVDLTKRTFADMRQNDYVGAHLDSLVRRPRIKVHTWIISSSAATCVLGTLFVLLVR
jgi:hypothetical protein